MTVAIIDYGSGNLRSAAKAFERAASDSGQDVRIIVTADPDVVAAADRVVLPGVGAFSDCLRGLEAVGGMRQAIATAVGERGRPFLGICVGMQLLATVGHEHGDHPGFDWIPGHVVPLANGDARLKIPQMGWNSLRIAAPAHPVLAGLQSGDHVYFVHSYHLVPDDPADRLAEVDYGEPIVAVVGHGTMVGTQFHPEKSQDVGLRLIRNFLAWRP